MNPRNLMHLVDTHKDKNNMFVGSVLDGSPAIRDDWSKYYTPRSLFDGKMYPIYVSGGGYIMSTSIATKLYHEIPYVRLIPIDDAFGTGNCMSHRSRSRGPENKQTRHKY